MKVGWGVGEVVAVLLSVATYLFKLTSPAYTLSLLLLLSGIWTLVAGLLLVDRKDRTFYSAWGIVVAILSLFAFLPLNYTIGLVLMAIVALILVTAYGGRSGKTYAASTQASSTPAGETPKAS